MVNRKVKPIFLWTIATVALIGTLVFIEIISSFVVNEFLSESSNQKDVKLAELYPQHSVQVARGMIKETWREGLLSYSPLVEVLASPFRGRYLNVYSPGYRNRERLPWPPPPSSVFLFGGSTTFGVGVSDLETIAHFLSKQIEYGPVYNLAAPTHHSTIERIHFFNLAVQGFVPRVAIFVDGLNDFIFYSVPDRSAFSNRLETASQLNYGYIVRKLLSSLNVVTLFGRLFNESPDFLVRKARGTRTEIRAAAMRLISNREIIGAYCKSRGIICIFVTQPVPVVNYDDSNRPVPVTGFRAVQNCVEGYGFLAEYYRVHATDQLLDLSQKRFSEPVYIDYVHYSASTNKSIAKYLAEYLRGDEDAS